MPSIKLKLKDLPDLGYLSTDNPPRGEILIKGNSVFNGYFRKPALTASVIGTDGWLALGDVGVLLPNGCLQMIDRVRSIVKLQHGLYVAPQYLENIYAQCPAVSMVFVSADSRADSVVAVIVPEKDYIIRRLVQAQGGKPDAAFYNKMT